MQSLMDMRNNRKRHSSCGRQGDNSMAYLASNKNKASVLWLSTPAVSAVALAWIVPANAEGSRPVYTAT